MGNCAGTCLPWSNRLGPRRENSTRDFTQLLEENTLSVEEEAERSFFVRLFSKRKSRRKKPVLKFVDDILPPRLNTYSRLNSNQQTSSNRDIPLQCLDAKALLARTTMSTPVSSVDLEWEHETLPNDPSTTTGSWTMLAEDLAIGGSSQIPETENAVNTESDWSRVSSTNSLEWDNAFQGTPPGAEVDPDTQFLLSEIERLTSRTLRETGRDLFS